MALPTIRAVGANAVGTTTATPGLPAGTAEGDLLITIVASAGNAANPAQSGYTVIRSLQNGTALTDSKLTVLWKIAGAGETATAVTGATNHISTRQIGITAGTFNAATPIHAESGGNVQASTTAVSITGLSTTVSDCLILAISGASLPDAVSSVQYSGWANASLANGAEQTDDNTNQGNGGGHGTWSGEKAASGTVDATTATKASAALLANLTIAIAPLVVHAGAAAVTLGVTTAAVSTLRTVSDPSNVASATTGTAHAGAAAVTLAVTTAAVGTATLTGAAAETLAITTAAVGTVSSPTTGAASETLSITAAAVGTVAHTGIAAETLSITTNAVGTVTTAHSGAAAETLSVTAAGVGTVAHTGIAAETLAITTAATGTVAYRATAAATLAVTTSAPGTVTGATVNWNLHVGRGYTDVNGKQIVRTTGNVAYAVVMECDAYPYQTGDVMFVYQANQTGIPSTFTQHATGVANAATIAAAIDANDKIHVLWHDRSGGQLYYRVWLTSTNAWEAAAATVDTGIETLTGQGDSRLSMSLDTDGVPHIVYLKTDGTRQRLNYRNRIGGTWSATTLLDSGVTYGSNERAWVPNIIFDMLGNRVVAWGVGTFNETVGTVYTRVYASGAWGSTISVDPSWIAIDQGTSMLATAHGTNSNRIHLTFLDDDSSGATTINYYYSDNAGATWTSNHPASGAAESHNPSLGLYDGDKVRIYGHGEMITGNHGADVTYFESDAGTISWGSRQLLVSGTNYDSSVNTRWSRYHHAQPGVYDLLYWNDIYPNELYYGGRSFGVAQTGAASETLSITTSAAGSVARTGAATETLAITTSGVATVAHTGAAAETLSIASTGAASITRAGIAAESLTITASGSGTVAYKAAAAETLSISTVAIGTITGAGGTAHSGAASETLSITTAAAGGVASVAAGSATAAITASGVGSVVRNATGAASLSISSSATPSLTIGGATAATLSATTAAVGSLTLGAATVAALSLSAAAAGQLTLGASAAAALAITATGTAYEDAFPAVLSPTQVTLATNGLTSATVAASETTVTLTTSGLTTVEVS